MKKVLSLIFAVALMLCTVVSASAYVSPDPSDPKKEIIVDSIPVPADAGVTTPDINNPARVEVGSGETVTLSATPNAGYKFSHWKVGFGEFDIVEGSFTTSVIVIKPTGTTNVRLEAYFVQEGTDITDPPSSPVETLPQDPTSPVTGVGNSSEAMSTVVTASAVMAMAVVAVVILKKKSNA